MISRGNWCLIVAVVLAGFALGPVLRPRALTAQTAPNPVTVLTRALADCKANGGGVINLTPGARYELDWGRQFKVPANTRINGNGATIVPTHLANGQISSIMLIDGTGVSLDGISFDCGQPEFAGFVKSSYFCIDSFGFNRLAITNCSATGAMSLAKVRSCKHLVIRDCIVEQGYYGVNFDELTHGRIENLWCSNVIRGLIATGLRDVSAQLTVVHDGAYQRVETPVVIKSYPTSGTSNAVSNVRLDVTIDGTVWRKDQAGGRIDLFRAVGIEIQGPANALSTRISGVTARVQFIGEQGRCAVVGFGRYLDSTEMPTLGPHVIDRVILEGPRSSVSPLVNSRSNTPGKAALWVPFVDKTLAL